ncbi:MAG: methyltransferase domain-containing protein, partial [Endomicrobia bacterium]|nr:methyltransferase domain-containing protein [Endomicrobiia bacterium]
VYKRQIVRKGQIIYPKDIGQILVLADIFPGAKVFECGCGSGALTLFLLRAVGQQGKVVAMDVREDMIHTTKKNIENYYNKNITEFGNFELILMDFKQSQIEEKFDRVIIDILDPWEVIDKIEKILLPSGIVVFWLPTVLQVFNLIDTIEKNFSSSFFLQGVYETLQREWEKNQLSLRPKHRMVAHTGFLIVYRKKSTMDENKL